MSIVIPVWILWAVGGTIAGVLMLLGVALLAIWWIGRDIDFRINW